MKFQATHIIINVDHAGEPIPIMLCQSPSDDRGCAPDNGGPAYTEAEWNSESTADYERDEDGAWLFHGKVFNGTVKAVTRNISTHIGFKEYHGSDTLYDGHFEPTLEGTVEASTGPHSDECGNPSLPRPCNPRSRRRVCERLQAGRRAGGGTGGFRPTSP